MKTLPPPLPRVALGTALTVVALVTAACPSQLPSASAGDRDLAQGNRDLAQGDGPPQPDACAVPHPGDVRIERRQDSPGPYPAYPPPS